jgi:hypothetical protein
MEPTAAPTAEPSVTESITGLPVETPPAPSNITGTVAEMLSAKKSDKKNDPKPEDQAKEKKLDDVDKKLREMLFKNKKKEKEEKPEEAKVEPAKPEEVKVETPVEEPAAPAPKKAPAKKAVVKDRAAELREKELELERQRLELERERLELDKSKAKPAQKIQVEDLNHLSADERYELEVFHVMSKLDQAKYGDLPERFTKVAQATAKYKAKWEQENPGESFDPDDSAHDAFFEKNQVKYDRKDFKRAEHRLATEGDTDPKVQELEKTNKELLAKHKIKELEPQIANVWAANLDAMIESISPDILKVAREGGKDKLLSEYPVEGEEILRAAEALNVFSVEAHRLLEGDGLFAPDVNNRVHSRILDVIRKQEQMIPAQSRENRLDPDGRDFATWAQWATMSPQQQANYWHLGAAEVVEIMSRDMGARVKYELERLEKLAESKNKRNQPKVEAPTIREKAPEHRSPAASPSSASKSSVDTSSKPAQPADDKLTKIIRSGLFKRSS